MPNCVVRPSPSFVLVITMVSAVIACSGGSGVPNLSPRARDAVSSDGGLIDASTGGRAGAAGQGVDCMRPRGNIREYPDAGPCDDTEPLRIPEGLAPSKDVLGQYAVTCDAVTPSAAACAGLPNDIWGACSLRRCAATQSYPQGCTVYLPTQNPFYPGPGQACGCTPAPPDATTRWTCGL